LSVIPRFFCVPASSADFKLKPKVETMEHQQSTLASFGPTKHIDTEGNQLPGLYVGL